MKIMIAIISGLFLIISGMIGMIIVTKTGNTDMQELGVQGESQQRNLNQGSKESINKKSINKGISSRIIVLNNNQQLGELPMDEGKIEITFEIENTGDEDVVLGDANGSCFCTQGYITNEDGSNKSPEFNTIGAKYPTDINRVIKAGEKQIVTAIYDPEAHGPSAVGPTSRGLTIKTNSASTPNIRLDFFGTVVKTRSK